MQKSKKKSRRLLRFVVIAVILILAPSIFLNFTYGLQYSRNKNNEFIGAHKEITVPPTTIPPTAPPLTTNRPTEIPPTVNPTTNRPTEYQPPTYPATVPPTVPATTNIRTEYQPPTISVNPPKPTSNPENYNPTEPTGSENYNPTNETEHTEHADDNVVPGGSHQGATEPSDNIAYEYTTKETTVYTEHIGNNIGSKGQNDNNGNIPQTSGGIKSNPSTGSSPKTGEDEIDPRFWLTILAVSAFILRYLLFFRAKPELDNEL